MKFDKFKSRLPATGDCRHPPPELVAEFRPTLPEALIEEWTTCGWCGFGDGLIWFEDPRLFGDFLAQRGLDGSHTVFARTAFADLFSVSDGVVYAFMTHYNEMNVVSDDFDLFGGLILPKEKFLRDFARLPLFKRALAKLGPLNHDECYGFVPALALGGEVRLENLKKVKLLQYLEILSQLH
jgi:hypothetical protein